MSLSAIAPHRVLNLGYMGFLGIGQGFAIGAQIAEPDRRVLQITGDGAYGFHIQELDTMVRHGLPIAKRMKADGHTGEDVAKYLGVS